MNFLTSLTQGSSFLRSVLKIGGTAVTVIGVVDPALGVALSTAFTAIGGLSTAAGLLSSFFAHKK